MLSKAYMDKSQANPMVQPVYIFLTSIYTTLTFENHEDRTHVRKTIDNKLIKIVNTLVKNIL